MITRGINNFNLPHLATKTSISNAQMLTSFTTPIEIVAAVPGYCIVPHYIHFFKNTGAYSIAGITNLLVNWSPAAGPVVASAAAGFLDSASERTIVTEQAGNTTGFAYCALGLLNGRGINVSLVFSPDAANPTLAAGGALEIYAIYYLFPLRMVI